MRGSVQFRNGRWRVDRSKNLASLISSEIILREFHGLLERSYVGANRAAILDLGAGAKPYAPLYETYFAYSVAVDVPYSPHDTVEVDVYALADRLPFDANSFDCVLCTEVLEHCRDPRAVMAEIERVLKLGGRVFLTTPFLVPLHEMPYDYYRYTPSALEDLAVGAGLSVVSIHPRGSYVAVALGVLLLPITKIWQKLANVTGMPLYHLYNPAVFLSIALPQILYLSLLRHVEGRPNRPVARLYGKLTYYTLGYVTELCKEDRGQTHPGVAKLT